MLHSAPPVSHNTNVKLQNAGRDLDQQHSSGSFTLLPVHSQTATRKESTRSRLHDCSGTNTKRPGHPISHWKLGIAEGFVHGCWQHVHSDALQEQQSYQKCAALRCCPGGRMSCCLPLGKQESLPSWKTHRLGMKQCNSSSQPDLLFGSYSARALEYSKIPFTEVNF